MVEKFIPKREEQVKKSEVDAKIKEELAKEGFEGGPEGGAAVVIGKKEEAERQRQLIESEGRAANLESYLRLHKKIVVPKEYVEIDDDSLKKPGTACLRDLYSGFTLFYIDKDGNIAQVDFPRYEKGLDIMGEDSRFLEYSTELENKLREFGFSSFSHKFHREVEKNIKKYNERKEEEKRQQSEKEFSF